MHTALIAATLLLASSVSAGSRGSGGRSNPGLLPARTATPHHLVINASASMAGTFVAGSAATLTTMHWATSGVGVGIGVNQTISLTVNGATLCSIVTPCTSVVGYEASTTCDAAIPAGADVEFTRSGCALGISSGILTYVLVQ